MLIFSSTSAPIQGPPTLLYDNFKC